MLPTRLTRELRQRRLAQFFAMYCVAAWSVLEVVDQLSGNGVLPEIAYRVALTLVLCGAPGVLIVTWFHGKKGDQRVPAREVWLLGGVGVFALTASGLVVRSDLISAEATGAGVSLGAWEDPRRVAVMYFDARGGDDDADFIAAGLSEGLIDELSAVEALHVVSKSGSAMFRDLDVADDSVARSLGVGTLVRGQVAIADDRVRVTVAMIEGASGRQLESQRLEADRDDLFALQDSLAAEVSLFLRQRIGEQVQRIEARRGTRVVDAWELLQRAERRSDGAQELADQGDPHGAQDEILAADTLLAMASAQDPSWSLPITRRGWLAYRQARLWGLQREPQIEPTERGLAHAEHALALDARDPDALELRGTLLYWRMLLNLVDPEEEHTVMDRAEADLRAAAAENPRQAGALASLSHLLLNLGDVTQAKLAALRSYEADPFLGNANLTLWRLASTSWELADPTETKRWCDEGLRRFPEDYRFHQCQLLLFALPSYPPDVPEAWDRLAALVDASPPQVAELSRKRGLMYVAMALVRADLPDSARAVALRARATAEVDPLREVAFVETLMRTWLGEYDEAARQLSLYLAANPSVMEGFRSDARRGQTEKWYFADMVGQPAFRALVGVR